MDEERSLTVGSNTTSVVINNLELGLTYDFKVYLMGYNVLTLFMVDLDICFMFGSFLL